MQRETGKGIRKKDQDLAIIGPKKAHRQKKVISPGKDEEQMTENNVEQTTPTLAEVVYQLERLYPLKYAENWDHPGLIVGDPLQPVKKIYMAVDPTLAIVREAAQWGADLLVTHHPLFFRAVHQIAATGHRGAVTNALEHNHIALWVGHTNADSAHRGVSEALADMLGVRNQKPIVPISDPDSPWDGHVGLGRVGDLEKPMSLRAFADVVNSVLPPTHRGIDVAGDLAMPVKRVAVLGGSGDSLFPQVRATGADVYVTSDLRHHPVLDARQQADQEAMLRAGGVDVSEGIITAVGQERPEHVYARPAFINTPHYASEKVWMKYALHDIPAALEQAGNRQVEMKLSPTDTDPFTLHLASPTKPVMPKPLW